MSLLPPFTEESARAKVKNAQRLWNSQDPSNIAKAYTSDSVWRNRNSFFSGTDSIISFLTAKWNKELNYRLRKELFAFGDDKIAVQFWYEYQDAHDGMKWKRCYGLEDWTFAADGRMRKRQMSGNDVEITEEQRWFREGVDVDTVDIGSGNAALTPRDICRIRANTNEIVFVASSASSSTSQTSSFERSGPLASPPATTYRKVTVDESTQIHYLEAGAKDKPTVLLLHGFPSSSTQYRDLAPLLAQDYHVIAPDLPGLGLTTVPSDFVYTFDNLANTISAFLASLQITSYAVYVFDYGAPVGWRLALRTPSAVKAIISQNGNAYVEGFGHPFWDPIEELWNTSNAETSRQWLKDNALTLHATKLQYTAGIPETDLMLINPSQYILDFLQNEAGPRNQDIQVDLFYDYSTNVDIYPAVHEYFRKTQVPLHAIWGKRDSIFVPSGAEAFKRDLPNAVIKFVDAGHFALETRRLEIAAEIIHFLQAVKW